MSSFLGQQFYRFTLYISLIKHNTEEFILHKFSLIYLSSYLYLQDLSIYL